MDIYGFFIKVTTPEMKGAFGVHKAIVSWISAGDESHGRQGHQGP